MMNMIVNPRSVAGTANLCEDYSYQDSVLKNYTLDTGFKSMDDHNEYEVDVFWE